MRTLSQETPVRSTEAIETPPEGDARSHQGSLRSKLVLSLAAIFFLFLLIDDVVRRRVIEPEFFALERGGAIRDANRVLAAVNSEVEHLAELAGHWAAQILDGKARQSTVEDIAGSDSWPMEKADWAAVVGSDGTWSWIGSGTKSLEMETDTAQEHLRSLVQSCRLSDKQVISGITRTGADTLVMVAIICLQDSSPVPERAPSHLVVARRVDEAMLATLCRQTQVEFALRSPTPSDSFYGLVVQQISQSKLMVKAQLSDINGDPVAIAVIQVPCDITARSSRTAKLARNSFIFGSVAALLMLLVMLQKIVIGPLAAIREHSNRVAQEGFVAEPLPLTCNDEIGQLASAFDKMVRNLLDAQTQLARASQATGRSQVASAVIHNVGNVLTNVNSLLDAATDGIEGLRIGPLEKLARRLRMDRGNDLLLDATPDYLEGLAGSLKSDQESIRELLATLHDNVRHIHDVIRDQQRHTDPSVKASRICIKDIVEEAITCCRARLDDDMISVELSGDLSTQVFSDRSLLLQTMINIIGNARQAMRENDDRARILSIDVTQCEKTVRILFRDNGIGMTQDTVKRVFEAHFTTRESGTGLGLHFCALTLKRLGGSIQAASEGPGRGATFVIELPGNANFSPIVNELFSSMATKSCATTS
jgi:signal transduction histidine kinase